MEAVIDGFVYQFQSYGGTSRLYSEILPRMCAMDGSLRIMLLTSGWCRHLLPTHALIQHIPLFPVDTILRPHRLWWPILPKARSLVQRCVVGNSRGIWHSTYYTMLEGWHGSTVVTVMDMIHERYAHLFNSPRNEQLRKQKRRCVLMADTVVCISETTRRDVLSFYGIDAARTRVVRLSSSPVFRRLRNAPPMPLTNRPFLLYVGDHRGHNKNSQVLLQAYSRWPHRKDVDLFFVGRQWSRRERRYLTRLGIADRVHFASDADDQRLCVLYNQASALMYPSLYEGFGIPLLEAMACGCPVIASRIPSTLEVAGECPIYFEPTEIGGLLAAFDIALSEGRDSERVRLGLERVKRYSWDETAEQMLEVYRALSGSV